MKTLYQFLSIIILSVVLVSCEEESNLQPEGLWELSSPELELPINEQSFVLI